MFFMFFVSNQVFVPPTAPAAQDWARFRDFVENLSIIPEFYDGHTTPQVDWLGKYSVSVTSKHPICTLSTVTFFYNLVGEEAKN
jgi:hypothetical protein